ncbi:2,3-bisphosphoglycerate-independent phosphoglycerate mutase [Bdellovibrionota bacterium FG-2]
MPTPMHAPQADRAVLIVLDGFGIGKGSPFNAIENAKMPFYKDLTAHYPHSEVLTHGLSVGLPEGIMGNSEVGHMTMGAGRIVYQDLTRISKTIRERSFFKNEVLCKTLEMGAKTTGKVHLMGLVSDGGVHSHMDHLFACLDLCVRLEVPRVCVHAFLDGRDTPPNSSLKYLEQLLKHPEFSGEKGGKTKATIATVMGRYWAMDRDQRWERVEKAYLALTGQGETGAFSGTHAALEAVRKSHENGKMDEFVEPVILDSSATMQDGDSVLFFNYRSDRAREITQAIFFSDFDKFDRKRGFRPSAFAGMTVYDPANTQVPAAFMPQNLNHLFGSWLEEKGLTQFRIAETEKFAHVTFFFNGGREKPFVGEERLLIPSPKEVATYDLKPEMSALQVASEAVKRIESQNFHFVLINFANADMVGHTGNYQAAITAMETLDRCLSQVIGAAERNGYHVLVTADHGNAEEMQAHDGQLHTQHTLNPVPALWIAPNSAIAPKLDRRRLLDGGLQDIIPTLCELMKIPMPDEMEGHSLIPKK